MIRSTFHKFITGWAILLVSLGSYSSAWAKQSIHQGTLSPNSQTNLYNTPVQFDVEACKEFSDLDPVLRRIGRQSVAAIHATQRDDESLAEITGVAKNGKEWEDHLVSTEATLFSVSLGVGFASVALRGTAAAAEVMGESAPKIAALMRSLSGGVTVAGSHFADGKLVVMSVQAASNTASGTISAIVAGDVKKERDLPQKLNMGGEETLYDTAKDRIVTAAIDYKTPKAQQELQEFFDYFDHMQKKISDHYNLELQKAEIKMDTKHMPPETKLALQRTKSILKKSGILLKEAGRTSLAYLLAQFYATDYARVLLQREIDLSALNQLKLRALRTMGSGLSAACAQSSNEIRMHASGSRMTAERNDKGHLRVPIVVQHTDGPSGESPDLQIK